MSKAAAPITVTAFIISSGQSDLPLLTAAPTLAAGAPMKLTLRELLLLVVIAAMGCGWWVHARQLSRERDQAVMERVVIDVAGHDAVPWMIAAAGLGKHARAEFNSAWASYQAATPKQQQQMQKSALAALSDLQP